MCTFFFVFAAMRICWRCVECLSVPPEAALQSSALAESTVVRSRAIEAKKLLRSCAASNDTCDLYKSSLCVWGFVSPARNQYMFIDIDKSFTMSDGCHKSKKHVTFRPAESIIAPVDADSHASRSESSKSEKCSKKKRKSCCKRKSSRGTK